MRIQNTIVNAIKKISFSKIVASLLLVTALFFATPFSRDSVIAASNKSATTYPTDDSNLDGLLYSDLDQVESLENVNDFVSPQRQKELLDATQIPARKQPILDRSNPNAKLLEKTIKMFKEAGDFSAN